ncbi:MAG: transposase [Anaerolineae bacterium]|nr:transposase [Anaerolineae bacterium]
MYTFRDFQKDFPNDKACLDWLMKSRFPDGVYCKVCKKTTKHHFVEARKSYSCQACGHHIHPTTDTIFEKSSTPLTSWFYAIYLLTQSETPISAKQLERELGVTYKTAWRMSSMIRNRLNDKNVDIFELASKNTPNASKRINDSETKSWIKTP